MAQQKDIKTGKWMYYGSYVDAKGKRKQYKKRGFDSKKEARKAEDDFREHIENPINYICFEKTSIEYLENAKKELKESSLTDAKTLLQKINREIGNVSLAELDDHYLQNYIDKLDATFSKAYVEKIYYRISKVLNYAVSKDYIPFNPLKKVKLDARKNETKAEMQFWEPSDFRKFIQNVDNQMYMVLFSFLYYMGTRRGEALALTWKDIDFNNNTVRINKTVSVKLNNKITSPKTSNSNRTISMPKALSTLLSDWKIHVKAFYGYSDDCLVFGHHKVLAVESMRRYFNKCIELTNKELAENDKIPRIRIHDLRHSHASYLINNMSAGFTDFDIAKRLGDTVSTLHNTYAHWFKAADKGIIDFMDSDMI